MDAFAPTEYTYWWAPLPTMRAWNEQRIRRRFADSGTQQFKVVDDASGDVVAWAKWDPPAEMTGLRMGFVVYDEEGRAVGPPEGGGVVVGGGGGEEGGGDGGNAEEGKGEKGGEIGEEEKPQTTLDAPEGADVKLFREFFDGITRMVKKWGASERLVLTHLCTSPAYHGRGIGSALLESVLELADAEGIPAYVESLRLAAPLYKRHGFVLVDRFEHRYDLSKAGQDETAVIDVLLRDPRKSG
ncbi:Uu.00g010060.m01.CDS01 [Anthostomella pinea]|uniref:Uu.00g010060.m01.CDS01 n=1 Tax=Anthostomella pinea TaxID=933095 RepID=A0AAI8YMN7_9PEZI|nr:Uu.00g010060.m01.CDS01 [Anthostomella pinea]